MFSVQRVRRSTSALGGLVSTLLIVNRPWNEGAVVVNPSSSLGAAVDLTDPSDSLGKVLY